jgi:GNAT superfamily N-acetyltransferase
MAERFITETEYKDVLKLSPENLERSVTYFLGNPDVAVFVSGRHDSPTGMIIMLGYEHPFTGERIASEMVWWVNPESRGDGIRLLKAAEGWAKEQGIPKISMIAPSARVGALYERLGYKAVETAYQKGL